MVFLNLLRASFSYLYALTCSFFKLSLLIDFRDFATSNVLYEMIAAGFVFQPVISCFLALVALLYNLSLVCFNLFVRFVGQCQRMEF